MFLNAKGFVKKFILIHVVKQRYILGEFECELERRYTCLKPELEQRCACSEFER